MFPLDFSGAGLALGVCQSAWPCWEAPQQGKSRERAGKALLTPLTIRCPSSQSTAGESPAPQLGRGWERLGSQGPPAPSSEAPGSRLSHTSRCWGGHGASPGFGGWKSHLSVPAERGLRHQAAIAHRKSREKSLLLAHIKKRRGSCWEKSSLTG